MCDLFLNTKTMNRHVNIAHDLNGSRISLFVIFG